MYSLSDYLMFFYIYAFLGWCCEVCFCSVNTGKFVNRGFLNGPWCPIYGFGAIIIISLLTPISQNIFVLFAGAVLLTTLLEGITGWLLKKLFHTTWWDYSDMPFNIGGYVCLAFSLMWGIGGCFVMRIIHPIIKRLVWRINPTLAFIILMAVSALFVVDLFVTVATIVNLNRKFSYIAKISAQLHRPSDKMAEYLGNSAIEAAEKQKELKLDLQSRLDFAKADLMDAKIRSYSRLLKAFPNMKHEKYNELLSELKEKYLKQSFK